MPSSSLCLREALPADLENVSHLWAHYMAYHREIGLEFPAVEGSAAAWAAGFERTLGRFSFIWVAVQDDELIGFLAGRVKRVPAYLGGVLVGEIADLWVEQAARGQGIASGLCRLALEKFHSLQVHSVEVQVLSANPSAQRFWEAHGFHSELLQYRCRLQREADDA